MTILSTRVARGAAIAAAAALLAASLAACTGTPAADTSTVTIAYDSDLAPQGYDPQR